MTGVSLPSSHSDEPSSPPEKMPLGVPRVGISILAVGAVILLLKYAQEVFIPFVLSGLLFYALDPVVDWLQKRWIPRALGAAVVLLTVVGAGGWTAYTVRDEALAVVEELPKAARNLRTAVRPARGAPEGTIDKIQRAATEIDKTTAEAMPSSSAPPGVVRVQVQEPSLRMTEFLGWGSVGIVAIVSDGLMGRAAQMNQVAVFAGLIFWSWLWGFWGVLLAVPMMMMVKAVCDHVEDLKPLGDFLGD